MIADRFKNIVISHSNTNYIIRVLNLSEGHSQLFQETLVIIFK